MKNDQGFYSGCSGIAFQIGPAAHLRLKSRRTLLTSPASMTGSVSGLAWPHHTICVLHGMTSAAALDSVKLLVLCFSGQVVLGN